MVGGGPGPFVQQRVLLMQRAKLLKAAAEAIESERLTESQSSTSEMTQTKPVSEDTHLLSKASKVTRNQSMGFSTTNLFKNGKPVRRLSMYPGKRPTNPFDRTVERKMTASQSGVGEVRISVRDSDNYCADTNVRRKSTQNLHVPVKAALPKSNSLLASVQRKEVPLQGGMMKRKSINSSISDLLDSGHAKSPRVSLLVPRDKLNQDLPQTGKKRVPIF